jgi:hypothetical protein
MKINLNQVKDKIRLLLEDKWDRESLSDWAFSKMNYHDEYRLEFEPKEKKDVIWDAITFLCGCDLKLSSTKYFHDIDEFEELLEKLEEVEE